MDQNLIKQCKTGQRQAQFLLYEECFPWLIQVCMRYMQDEDEARSILNVGFLKILDGLKSYRPEVPFEAWCKRIMINTIIDAFRKTQTQRRKVDLIEMDQASVNRHVDYNLADLALDASQYEWMIQQLPEMPRKVFNLFAIDGFTHAEIGKLLSISAGTSKWYLNVARENLKKMVSELLNLENSQLKAARSKIS
ncbi:MAG: sigma-70 family RNA polymerase sigma factor [Saprospiraceae bacterium]